jgi:type III secretion protein V
VLSYQELAPEFNVQPLATIAARQGSRPASRSLPTGRAATGQEAAS